MIPAIRLATLAAAASLFALGACQKSQTDAPPTNGSVSNTIPNAPSAAVDAARQSTASAVGAVTAPATTPESFVQAVGASDMFEIQAARLAERKSANPDVKKFAARMIRDHTASSHKLETALTKGAVPVTLPAALDDHKKALLDQLASAAPADFDKTYVDQQVAAHQQAADLFNGYAQKGDNAALKAFATAGQPMISAHLGMIKDIQASMAKT